MSIGQLRKLLGFWVTGTKQILDTQQRLAPAQKTQYHEGYVYTARGNPEWEEAELSKYQEMYSNCFMMVIWQAQVQCLQHKVHDDTVESQPFYNSFNKNWTL